MLVLKIVSGQSLRVFDAVSHEELGRTVRLRPRDGHPSDVYLGFQLSPRIRILRDELVIGKDAAIRFSFPSAAVGSGAPAIRSGHSRSSDLPDAGFPARRRTGCPRGWVSHRATCRGQQWVHRKSCTCPCALRSRCQNRNAVCRRHQCPARWSRTLTVSLSRCSEV
jgi:hypothetical protein